MADIKTYLREIGVAIGIYILLRNKNYDSDEVTPSIFSDTHEKITTYSNTIPIRLNFAAKTFTDEEKTTLRNSFKLAEALISRFNIKKEDKIIWCGNDTQKKDPVDLIVGNHSFSLKEDSFILENMGLYKYLHLLTNKDFKRGLHIYEHFAPKEYQNLFNYVWNIFIKEQKEFIYKGKGYTSQIKFHGKEINLIYKNKEGEICSKLPLEQNLDINIYTAKTEAITREKVFSKWVKERLEQDSDYQNIRKGVSETTAKNLVDYVRSNLDPEFNGLKRLLQIYDIEYFYAKSTSSEVKIYRVPSLEDFEKNFTIQSVDYKVPESQINIYTTIVNKVTKDIVVLRNEIRFSHGQFNGTPEAKMYYEKDTNLENIYEKDFVINLD